MSYPTDKEQLQCRTAPTTDSAISNNCLAFSIIFLPHHVIHSASSPYPSHRSLHDTVARAMTWLTSSQASGVPISFLNIQTEPLLTKAYGELEFNSTSSITSGGGEASVDACNEGMYCLEDYHGIDIGVLRAVRLWWVPSVPELHIVLEPEEGESKLGLGIYRTDEGFCCVSSIENGSIAQKAGLGRYHMEAQELGNLLVISRVGNERIVPTMVSSSGSIHCFDAMSISQKLALHRHIGQAIHIYILAVHSTSIYEHQKSSKEYSHIFPNALTNSSTASNIDRVDSFSFPTNLQL